MMLKRCKGFKYFYLLLWNSIKFTHDKIQITFLRLQHLKVLRGVWNALMNSSFFKFSIWRLFPGLSLRVNAMRNNISRDLFLIYFFNNRLILGFFHSIKRILMRKRGEGMFLDQNLKIFIMSSLLLFSFLLRSQDFNFSFHGSKEVLVCWTSEYAWFDLWLWSYWSYGLELFLLLILNSFLSSTWNFSIFNRFIQRLRR